MRLRLCLSSLVLWFLASASPDTPLGLVLETTLVLDSQALQPNPDGIPVAEEVGDQVFFVNNNRLFAVEKSNPTSVLYTVDVILQRDENLFFSFVVNRTLHLATSSSRILSFETAAFTWGQVIDLSDTIAPNCMGAAAVDDASWLLYLTGCRTVVQFQLPSFEKVQEVRLAHSVYYVYWSAPQIYDSRRLFVAATAITNNRTSYLYELERGNSTSWTSNLTVASQIHLAGSGGAFSVSAVPGPYLAVFAATEAWTIDAWETTEQNKDNGFTIAGYWKTEVVQSESACFQQDGSNGFVYSAEEVGWNAMRFFRRPSWGGLVPTGEGVNSLNAPHSCVVDEKNSRAFFASSFLVIETNSVVEGVLVVRIPAYTPTPPSSSVSGVLIALLCVFALVVVYFLVKCIQEQKHRKARLRLQEGGGGFLPYRRLEDDDELSTTSTSSALPGEINGEI